MNRPSDYLKIGWTQKDYAVDKDGKPVDVSSPDATQWCPAGALFAAKLGYEVSRKIEDAFIASKRMLMSKWNETPGLTKGEVVAAMQAAESAVLG